MDTETKEENCRLDYPALSCNDVSVWTSTVVARERRLGPRRAQQRRCQRWIVGLCNAVLLYLCTIVVCE